MKKLKIGRRDFIGVGLAGAAAALGYGLFHDEAEAPLLRPPGAQDEEEFLGRCLRCQECVRACPTGCLEPADRDFGTSSLWTPRFNPALAKCDYGLCGRACARACPVGALCDVPDEEVRLGTASVNRSLCIAWAEGKDCLVCQERCAYNAIEFDERGRPHVVSNRCTGCGACQNTCVTCPNPAIVVYPPGTVTSGGGGRRNRGN
ncbi:MAG: 4Fe-4S dicluster domain-containing protein [Actinomycetota bacterium]|nr:4Fe-4S dicluster domain-containing protein [Actinomycetota bacterium]